MLNKNILIFFDKTHVRNYKLGDGSSLGLSNFPNFSVFYETFVKGLNCIHLHKI